MSFHEFLSSVVSQESLSVIIISFLCCSLIIALFSLYKLLIYWDRGDGGMVRQSRIELLTSVTLAVLSLLGWWLINP